MISNVRPGVIRVYEGGKVTEEIFAAGGFAEVTPARCTVLADQAMPVAELDRAAAEQRLKDEREDLADAKTDEERTAAEKQIAVCEETSQDHRGLSSDTAKIPVILEIS